MRYIMALALLINLAYGQKLSKHDRFIVDKLNKHINFLADDFLEGRRAGTKGEKLAADYISGEFREIGLTPVDTSGYFQHFDITEARKLDSAGFLIIDDKQKLLLGKDYYPLPFTRNGEAVFSSSSMSLHENGSVWFFDIVDVVNTNKNNPHFDLFETIRSEALDAINKGAGAFFVYTSSLSDTVPLITETKLNPLDIAVIYVTRSAMKTYFSDTINFHDYKINVSFLERQRTGTNVVGIINNNTTLSVVIGAHYDHLGYGEDKNSLYTGQEKMIHNGADDNASGTAALIELARMIKKEGLKKYNYLFVAFSGEELGLFGSKYFTEHSVINMKDVNYMINMDMVGRLKDSTHSITVGGYATSPQWQELLPVKNNKFNIKIDSSGVGPSDHTSFYRKDIPVLFFFTGLHSDYHKPTDDADKINYNGGCEVIKLVHSVITGADKTDRLLFTKTSEKAMSSSSSFKVSLGIMPDYTFSGEGVRADGISEGRPAQKAGLRAGDIIVQLNDFLTPDLQKYMEVLGKFNKGDKATVLVKRGSETLLFNIVF